MGHIELAVACSHIWFFKCLPSRVGLMVDMTARALERVIYYEDYIVIDAGKTPLKEKQLLSEMEYREALEQYGTEFVAKMGAEGVRELLQKVDLNKVAKELEIQLNTTKSKQVRKKLSKRLKLVQGFTGSKARPEWMILTALPKSRMRPGFPLSSITPSAPLPCLTPWIMAPISLSRH